MGPFLLHLCPMKAICGLLLLSFLFITACGKKEEVKGIIFERKELPNNRLLIRYHYAFNNNTYYDSATVSNKILPIDSINVLLDPAAPHKALPELSGK